MSLYTLDELWKRTYEEYEITFDNKGNFKLGKGIVPNKIIKESEKEIKRHITARRKKDINAKILWNKKNSYVSNIIIK